MNYDYLIWDFNGTIIDDVRTGIESVNAILSKYHLPTIDSIVSYHEKFRFPIKDYYRALGFDFDKIPYETVAKEWVKQYADRAKDIPLVENVREVLQHFSDQGIKQIILSASELQTLIAQLRFYGIDRFFDQIIGLDNIYAGGKEAIAKAWRSSHCGNMIVIGDTSHDYQIAEIIQADCILFSGGHEGLASLRTHGVPVISNLLELIDYVR